MQGDSTGGGACHRAQKGGSRAPPVPQAHKTDTTGTSRVSETRIVPAVPVPVVLSEWLCGFLLLPTLSGSGRNGATHESLC